MHRALRLPALALLVAAAPAGAQAVYAGTGAGAAAQAAAFLAALPVRTTEQFDALPNTQLVVTFGYAGGTATLSNGFGVTDAYPYNGTAVSPTRGYGVYPDSAVGDDGILTFTSPVRAFGAYFVDVEPTADLDFLTFSFLGGGTQSFQIPIAGDGGVSFLGVDFGSNVVTGVLIDLAHDDAVLIDDATVGVATAPEPATWTLRGAVLVASAGAISRPRASARAASK
jgi:hypothetical protein